LITKVKLVSINVKDQDRALAFYTEKLGFTLLTDQPMGPGEASRWIEVQPPEGGAKVVLFKQRGEGPPAAPMSNIIFTTPDVRRTYEELKERGVEFSEPPTEQFWGTYAIFSDPDGNKFVLSSDT
jgi:catechol 2,3-dioxygenase-like lactoylglutathione lyase family enzyme